MDPAATPTTPRRGIPGRGVGRLGSRLDAAPGVVGVSLAAGVPCGGRPARGPVPGTVPAGGGAALGRGLAALVAGRTAGGPRRADLTGGLRVDLELAEQVVRGGIGLLRIGQVEGEGLVDHLPPGDVGPVDQSDRDALSAGPAGAADPVHVRAGVLGALVVDHVGDAGDVDPAGRHVGGHQDVDASLTEPVQRLFPGRLCPVTVDRCGGEAALAQVVGHPLGLALRPAEDHHPVAILRLQDPGHELGLVEWVRLIDELAGGGDGLHVLLVLGPDVHRRLQVRTGEGDDRGGHRGGEHQRLAILRRLRHQPFDVGQEAEVEHLVGLVQDGDAHPGQIECPTVGEVEEPSGRADHDIDALSKGFELRFVRRAAVDREDPCGGPGRGGDQILAHLVRQLPRGGDDQGLGAGAVAVLGVGREIDALEQREPERERLARPGAGLPDQVTALQGDRDGHFLDREGVHDAVFREGFPESGVDPEIGECCGVV
ncbi:hypothetical protein SDC9_63067 [bioreactor metagenome]|uniref:Uncharacterized protein n=1 Tax=bioreactor metagenome TaxID=1076179 RepID=A0A644XKG7_9ZZZZ